MPPIDPDLVKIYADAYNLPPRTDQIDYLKTSAEQFELKIPLIEYFELVKRHRADAWQRDFAEKLEKAAINRHARPTRALIHCESQLGKSVILAQCYPAWLLGHDPLIRIALATYNVTRSQAHSRAILSILGSPAHKSIFPESESGVSGGASMAGWQTNARRGLGTGDAQFSFNPVGLQSGLTGSGFNCLLIDDPYSDQKEAFSETVRQNLINFWEYTVLSRLAPDSNVFGMFHRYHFQDLAGYLLARGDFDYWRYATIADGDFIDSSTGKVYPDPLSRSPGEYISPTRRPPEYYSNVRSNTRVWNSMFQGRPAPESGDFFQTERVAIIREFSEIENRRFGVTAALRAWDNAAVEGGGDWSVGVKMGIDSHGLVTVFDAVKAQYATETRLQLQKRCAARDGVGVVISVPQDPASAGKDVVFFTRRELEGYTVVSRPTTGRKAVRAMPLADAIRDGRVSLIAGEWNDWFLSALQQFGFSDFDHPVDAAADGYNWLVEQLGRGLVLKDFDLSRHMVARAAFFEKYSNRLSEFNIYASISIRSDASLPNAGVIVGVPPEREGLGKALILLAEYSRSGVPESDLFDWLEAGMRVFGGEQTPSPTGGNANFSNRERIIYMDAATRESFGQVIWQKLTLPISEADLGDTEGIAELSWYLRQGQHTEAVGKDEGKLKRLSERFFVTGGAEDFPAFYREVSSWGYDSRGKPTLDAPVLNCLRVLAAKFHAGGQELTVDERIEQGLPEHLRRTALKHRFRDVLQPLENNWEYDTLLRARLDAVKEAREQLERGTKSKVYGKPVFGARYKK